MLNSGLQHMLRNLSILILTTFTLIGCSDECREYSDFSCDDIEKASYEVTVNEKFGTRTNEYLFLFDNSSRILGFNGKQTNLYAAKNTYWNRRLIPIKSSNGIAKIPVNCKHFVLFSDLK